MNALVGHTGLIGTVIGEDLDFDRCYNSANIDQIQDHEFDVVYCAAPSGNRWLANKTPELDNSAVANLIQNLKTVKAKKFVLISSVDAMYAPESVYGGNRLALELFAQTQFDTCHVVRLCTLIHPRITKNLLFDIRHQQHLDCVNGAMIRQYYPLSRLAQDIRLVMAHNIANINLVSEPVSDQEVMQMFCPGRTLITNSVRPYNLHSTYPFGQYVLSKQQVFEHISEYMHD